MKKRKLPWLAVATQRNLELLVVGRQHIPLKAGETIPQALVAVVDWNTLTLGWIRWVGLVAPRGKPLAVYSACDRFAKGKRFGRAPPYVAPLCCVDVGPTAPHRHTIHPR